MTEKKKQPRFNITSDAKLTDELRYLSDMTKKTQIGILHEIIDRMTEIASSFTSFGYWIDDSGSQIQITFYGKSRMVTGKLENVESLGVKANAIFNEEVLQKDIEHLERQATEDKAKPKKRVRKL